LDGKVDDVLTGDTDIKSSDGILVLVCSRVGIFDNSVGAATVGNQDGCCCCCCCCCCCVGAMVGLGIGIVVGMSVGSSVDIRFGVGVVRGADGVGSMVGTVKNPTVGLMDCLWEGS
jgi:hypothetical protein